MTQQCSRRTIAVLAGAAMFGTMAVTPAWAASQINRWAGENRYETSAVISENAFPTGASTVFIASGTNYPDALSGAPVAAMQGAPVLLTDPDVLNESVREELARLDPDEIVILGGLAAVSAAVATDLENYADSVERWDGATRYETSAKISEGAFEPGVEAAFIASGAAFPDALAGAPVAGCTANPVLLTDPAGLSEAVIAELERLDPDEIIVLGGSAAVSDAVEGELEELTEGSVNRVSGANRYATSAAIAAEFFPGEDLVPYLATGLNFPDALAGAAVAGSEIKGCGPILLAGRNGLTDEVRGQFERIDAPTVVVLGGTAAVDDATAQQAANPHVQPQDPPQDPGVQPRPASPDLDCEDFDSHEEAQATYDHWVNEGLGDVHRLDADDDGIACETLLP